MNAPDRRKVVQQIANAHPEAFGPPEDTHDARRLDLLRRHLLPALNLMDQGEWGLLRKDDQGGKVPCDVIVWRSTREHFDVLTRNGATWIAHGPFKNPMWHWHSGPVAMPEPISDPPPTPVLDLATALAQLDAFSVMLARHETRLSEVLAQTQRIETLANLMDTHLLALKPAPPPNYEGAVGPFRLVLKPQK